MNQLQHFSLQYNTIQCLLIISNKARTATLLAYEICNNTNVSDHFRCKRLTRFQEALNSILMCSIYRKITEKLNVLILKKVQQNLKITPNYELLLIVNIYYYGLAASTKFNHWQSYNYDSFCKCWTNNWNNNWKFVGLLGLYLSKTNKFKPSVFLLNFRHKNALFIFNVAVSNRYVTCTAALYSLPGGRLTFSGGPNLIQ